MVFLLIGIINIMHDNQNKEIVQWGREYLLSHGHVLKSELPENVQNTPWSYVVRFVTSDGYIYLKQTPKMLALEAIIIQVLHEQFHAAVPEVIARNAELNCFLMRDAGRPLREILKKQFDILLLCKAIDQFTSLQLAVANHVNVFFDIGVADWRLDKLPGLYKQLLSQKDILLADGLSEIEINKLKTLFPRVSELCEKLSTCSIKQTIVQCDFHDNNLLVDDISKNITMIDLGEIVISHPFFSLIGCLRQAKTHHMLKDEDRAYFLLMDACFKNFLVVESKQNILNAFVIAQILWFLYEALAQYRLRLACDETRFNSYQQHGKLSARLKEFITACID